LQQPERLCPKIVFTETSKIELEVPRDRLSTFDPQLIAKYQRRFPGFDEKIVCNRYYNPTFPMCV